LTKKKLSLIVLEIYKRTLLTLKHCIVAEAWKRLICVVEKRVDAAMCIKKK